MGRIALMLTLPLVFGAAVTTLHTPSIRTVYNFPNSTWIENLAIRGNGQIVANDLYNPYIYLVDPDFQLTPPPILHTFPPFTSFLGITELHPDIFVALSLQGDIENSIITPNSTAIWQVDMRSYSLDIPDSATVKKLADLPPVVLPNGVTVLSSKDKTVLIADSGAGLLYRFDTCSMNLTLAIDDPLFKSSSTGLNGIRVVGGSTLYFTNTRQGLVGTIPINPDGHAIGPAKVLAYASNADDFDIGPDGSVWVAQNNNNTLTRIRPDGSASVVAGSQDSDVLNGPTVAKFGRRADDEDVLYVGTDGLFTDPGTGDTVEKSAKIVAIDTSVL